MIAGMLAMMEICVRVRDGNSSCIIPTVGYRQSTTSNNARRRSFMGKLFRKTFNRNSELSNSESTPIYSVTSEQYSVAAALLPPSPPSTSASSPPSSPSVSAFPSSYQQQARSVDLAANGAGSSDRTLNDLNGSGSGSSIDNQSHNVLNYESSSQECSMNAIRSGSLKRSRPRWSLNKCEQLEPTNFPFTF